MLVGNNNLIVYTNSATDPYTDGNPSLLLSQNQSNLDAVIGKLLITILDMFLGRAVADWRELEWCVSAD